MANPFIATADMNLPLPQVVHCGACLSACTQSVRSGLCTSAPSNITRRTRIRVGKPLHVCRSSLAVTLWVRVSRPCDAGDAGLACMYWARRLRPACQIEWQRPPARPPRPSNNVPSACGQATRLPHIEKSIKRPSESSVGAWGLIQSLKVKLADHQTDSSRSKSPQRSSPQRSLPQRSHCSGGWPA